MGRNARKLVSGIVRISLLPLVLPLAAAQTVAELVHDEVWRPLDDVLDNWVNDTPDNKEA